MEPSLESPLLNSQIEESQCKQEKQAAVNKEIVDQLYDKSYNHFLFCLRLSLFEYALKVVTIPIFLPKTVDVQITIWLYSFLCFSTLQFIWCFSLLQKALKIQVHSLQMQVYYEVAGSTNHLRVSQGLYTEEYPSYRVSVEHYDFEDESGIRVPEEDERRFKEVSSEIKERFESATESSKLKCMVLAVAHHLLHVWGYSLMFTEDELIATFITILILPGTIRYFEFYLIVAFCLVFAPVYFSWVSLKTFVRMLLDRYRHYRIFKKLSGTIYETTVHLKGDPQCNICMENYLPHQKILTLQCSEMHHFHEKCMKDWAKIRLNCPMCRTSIK